MEPSWLSDALCTTLYKESDSSAASSNCLTIIEESSSAYSTNYTDISNSCRTTINHDGGKKYSVESMRNNNSNSNNNNNNNNNSTVNNESNNNYLLAAQAKHRLGPNGAGLQPSSDDYLDLDAAYSQTTTTTTTPTSSSPAANAHRPNYHRPNYHHPQHHHLHPQHHPAALHHGGHPGAGAAHGHHHHHHHTMLTPQPHPHHSDHNHNHQLHHQLHQPQVHHSNPLYGEFPPTMTFNGDLSSSHAGGQTNDNYSHSHLSGETESNDYGPYTPQYSNYNGDRDSGSESEHQREGERQPVRKRPGRPRGSRRKKPEKLGRLWEFIRDLLLSPESCPSLICWDNYEEGMFRFVHSDKVAKLWGAKRDNPDMNYEKLSRAMRYYYKSNVLQPVFGRRLVYKFGPEARGWRTENPNFRC